MCGGKGYKNYGEKPEMHEGEVPLVSTETWDLARMANYPPSFQDEVLGDAGFLVLRKEGRI